MIYETAKLVLLPSMRFARPFQTMSDGKKIYISTEGRLLCEHGELASTINYWTSAEKKAKSEGREPPSRGGFHPSICDCVTTEGMNVAIPADVCLPVRPSSLFDFLEATNTEWIKVKGRDARRIPHVPGPAFVSTVGRVTCRHGASRLSLIKKERFGESKRRPNCGCKLKALSLHGSLKGLQLGKFGKLKVPFSPTASSEF